MSLSPSNSAELSMSRAAQRKLRLMAIGELLIIVASSWLSDFRAGGSSVGSRGSEADRGQWSK